ncbi:MAG TPA: heat-inducible transcription repressor HrcA [Firmicutes bacterium]|jgi:heat-inducible transcriptional repressor|nr:heat-inducible transcription repressor HrcA [Bacillota bacterium]
MLSERKRRVLEAVVREYIATAEPVGSRTLYRRHNLGVSSATIRNEMADLEEMGYLEQPHTSAGRVPSDLGYRFYVDHLMQKNPLTHEEEELLRQVPALGTGEADVLLGQASRLLSQVSNYISLVVAPRVEPGVLKTLKLVHLEEHLAMAVLFTDRGRVESRVLVLPPEIQPEDLEGLARYFTRRLAGRPLEEITGELLSNLYAELLEDYQKRRNRLAELAQAILNWLAGGERGERIYMGGTQNILSQPEFQDLEKVRRLFALLEEEKLLYKLLEREPGVTVTIGQENQLAAIRECAVITSTYSVDGRPVGTLAILGPTRMDYPHVIALLEYMARCLSDAFSRSEGRGPAAGRDLDG